MAYQEDISILQLNDGTYMGINGRVCKDCGTELTQNTCSNCGKYNLRSNN